MSNERKPVVGLNVIAHVNGIHARVRVSNWCTIRALQQRPLRFGSDHPVVSLLIRHLLFGSAMLGEFLDDLGDGLVIV